MDHNFFAPRRTQQRDNDNDNNNNNNNNNERQQHRQRVDDNTNEANVDNSVIGELYPPPIFATNYSLSGGQEGNADDIESALRVTENPYTLANQALLNQRRIVGPDPDIPPRNRSHSGSSKSKSRHTTAVSTTNERPTDPEVSSVSAQPNRSRSHSNQSSRTTAGSTTNERSSAQRKVDSALHSQQLHSLQQSLDETPDDMQAEFTSPNESTRVRPAPNATDIETQARPEIVNAQVQVQTCCELGLGGCLANSQPTNTRKPKRCRNCGVSSEHDNFRQWHSQPPLPVTGNGSENLRNTAANQVHDFCNTPNNEIRIGLGYPLKEGQRHPRRR